MRTAIQALAAVLGGTQSLHTNSLDETYALPTEESARIALRTQQIIAHESGVTNTIDPLGGSYFVEEMTQRMVDGAFEYFRRIDELGGMVEAIEVGFPQREIVEAAYAASARSTASRSWSWASTRSRKEATIRHRDLLYVSDDTAAEQIERLNAVRASRDARRRDAGARRAQARRGGHREHDAAADRLREGLLHGRRDQRRVARGVGHLRRAAGVLAPAREQRFQASLSAVVIATRASRSGEPLRP